MKFEKLSENKIRITLTPGDFEEKHIDFQDFMSNPLESQDLFLDILEEAKSQIGFNTSDYRVKIEALAMIDGDFVVNVTRAREPNIEKSSSNSSVVIGSLLHLQVPTRSFPSFVFAIRGTKPDFP